MSDTTVLNRLFNPSAMIALETTDYAVKKVVLQEEKHPQCKIEILNIPGDAIVIDLDSNFSNEKLFAGDSGENKRADFLVFSALERKVLFIEMKHGKAKEGDIVKQLKGSLCVFEYCQTIAREYFCERDFLVGYDKRFICLKYTGGSKGATKINKTVPLHDTPDSVLKISGMKKVQFRMLAA